MRQLAGIVLVLGLCCGIAFAGDSYVRNDEDFKKQIKDLDTPGLYKVMSDLNLFIINATGEPHPELYVKKGHVAAAMAGKTNPIGNWNRAGTHYDQGIKRWKEIEKKGEPKLLAERAAKRIEQLEKLRDEAFATEKKLREKEKK